MGCLTVNGALRWYTIQIRERCRAGFLKSGKIELEIS